MTRTHSKTALYKDQKVWFFGLLSILVGLFALYIYFLASSVFDVVVRKEIEQNMVSTSSQVGQLESQYAQLQNAINPEVGATRGYVAAADKIFIDRTETSLAFNSGE